MLNCNAHIDEYLWSHCFSSHNGNERHFFGEINRSNKIFFHIIEELISPSLLCWLIVFRYYMTSFNLYESIDSNVLKNTLWTLTWACICNMQTGISNIADMYLFSLISSIHIRNQSVYVITHHSSCEGSNKFKTICWTFEGSSCKLFLE